MIQSMPSKSKIARLLLFVTLLCTPGAFGATIASDYVGGGTTFNFADATGWFFTPSGSISVTALGYYDLGTPGLADLHDVGIFLANGTLVVSVTIPSGTAATFVPGTVGGTRFVSITPVLLTGGVQYYIDADNNVTDQYAFGTGAVTYAVGITWNGFGDSNSNSIFDTVSNDGGVPGNLGPNFQFDAAVPEPGSVVPMLFAIAALGLRRLRRK